MQTCHLDCRQICRGACNTGRIVYNKPCMSIDPKYREDGNRYATHDRKHNPLTFYLRMLLYMFVGLLLRLLALAPLACLFVFPAGSPLKLLALLCPVLLVLLVLPLRYSFAEAMVRRDGRRYFSFDTALNLGNYGEKLAESLLHAAHVIKWGIPFFAMLIYGYYWYKEVDALTLLSTLTRAGPGMDQRLVFRGQFLPGTGGRGSAYAAPEYPDGRRSRGAGCAGAGVAVWRMARCATVRRATCGLMPTAMIILPAKSFAAVCAAADWPSWA